MAQLESPENLAKLSDPRWRLLFPLLMETGLRVNDALHLPTTLEKPQVATDSDGSDAG